MNLRPSAVMLASCVLATAVLSACGTDEPSASPKAAAPPSTTAGSGTAGAAEPTGAETAGTAGSAGAAGTTGPGSTGRPAASEPGRPAGAPATAALPPRPDSRGEAAYVRALTAIDPDIVHDDESGAVDRGRAQCRTIRAFPGDTARQISEAERRFTSPGHPQGFGRAKAARIVDAVHTQLCPDF